LELRIFSLNVDFVDTHSSHLYEGNTISICNRRFHKLLSSLCFKKQRDSKTHVCKEWKLSWYNHFTNIRVKSSRNKHIFIITFILYFEALDLRLTEFYILKCLIFHSENATVRKHEIKKRNFNMANSTWRIFST
jgi:hypothetical protein